MGNRRLMEHAEGIEIELREADECCEEGRETEIKDLTKNRVVLVLRDGHSLLTQYLMVTQRFSKTLRISSSCFVGNG
jgi:hypothetical protein